jgi:hypothetical protein
VAQGQVFTQNFGFPCQSTFHLLLHNHLHYHSRLAQYARSGRSANSLTNEIKKIKKTLSSFQTFYMHTIIIDTDALFYFVGIQAGILVFKEKMLEWFVN